MIIKSSTKEYEVNIQQDFSFVDKIKQYPNKLIVVDKKIYELYGEKFFSDISQEDIYIIEALEKNKTIDVALELCEHMTEIPAKRNAHLISFGGGIIQDITGFVTNVLYRGIDWTFVPTTLLAACDSCIGGKTSLNYKGFKNLLGTFFPPNEIFICPKFFQTLSEKDFKSGLGEVVKFNVMFGEKGIENIEENIDLLLQKDEKTLNRFVESSLQFKKKFIEVDEFDRSERIKLNFAHTFGHAFETISNYEIPHGTAVAMGTIVANEISHGRGYLCEELQQRMENVLLKIINISYQINIDDIEDIMNAIKKDKKQVNSNITAVIFDDKMELMIVHDLTKTEIISGISHLLTLL